MRPLTRRLLTAVALTASLGVALAGCDKKESVSADDMARPIGQTTTPFRMNSDRLPRFEAALASLVWAVAFSAP